nr:aquaporin-7-like [Zootoca vivipara]
MLKKVIGWLTIRNETIRQGLAEALSTFILMVIGQGSVAQVVLGRNSYGQFLSINLGFGFGVMLGIHVAGGISGAHMNAAITFANCVVGNLPWYKLPAYVIGQFMGSFLASAMTFALYYEALIDYTGGTLTVGGPSGTANIFATYPSPYVSTLGGFINEFMTTTVLLIGILAINDLNNAGALPGTHALSIGLLVAVIGMSLGMNTGYAINPSRDLPQNRAGASNHWWWVPIVAPMLGSLFGIFIYNIFIDFHNRPRLDGSRKPDCKGEETIEQSL